MAELEIKEAVRQRDGYKCTGCGMTNDEHLRFHGRQLDVHRTVPISAYTLEGCITVCKKCHAAKHAEMPREPRPAHNNAVSFRPSAEWREWLAEFAAHRRATPTGLIDQALTELARREKFRPPPRRI